MDEADDHRIVALRTPRLILGAGSWLAYSSTLELYRTSVLGSRLSQVIPVELRSSLPPALEAFNSWVLLA